MTTTVDLNQWHGRKAVDSQGEKLGEIESSFQDQYADGPDWIVVSTGLLGRKHNVAPARDAEEDDGSLRLAWTKKEIEGAPNVDDDQPLSEEDERKLFEHYGLDWSDHDASRDFGDKEPHSSEGAPVTHGEDDDIRDPDSGTRPESRDMVLPEHVAGVRPTAEDTDRQNDETGRIKPYAVRAAGLENDAATPADDDGGEVSKG